MAYLLLNLSQSWYLISHLSPAAEHRACLAATIRSSGASQSTIKLVATNLIANSMLFGEGNLLVGVAVIFRKLSLVFRGSSASVPDRQRSGCLSLPSDIWWVASLCVAGQVHPGRERCRWGVLKVGRPSHLCWSQPKGKSMSWLSKKSVGKFCYHFDQSKALLVMLSLGKFYKVIEMLYRYVSQTLIEFWAIKPSSSLHHSTVPQHATLWPGCSVHWKLSRVQTSEEDWRYCSADWGCVSGVCSLFEQSWLDEGSEVLLRQGWGEWRETVSTASQTNNLAD